jgi:hypothetical protein
MKNNLNHSEKLFESNTKIEFEDEIDLKITFHLLLNNSIKNNNNNI